VRTTFSTGITGLDHVLKGLLPGDNVVWQVDAIDDYAKLATPYVRAARAAGQPLVYLRFASHPPLIDGNAPGVVTEVCDPGEGFEPFTNNVHRIIKRGGRGACYVFDCLSDLADVWSSDQMLGNFFMLTCPYLFDLETLAYFAVSRHHHSARALRPIMDTAQLFMEVYRHQEAVYIRPMKVQHRYSPTMNTLHVWRGEDLHPVTSSTIIAEILTASRWSGLHSDERPGFWDEAFIEAAALHAAVGAGQRPADEEQPWFARLARMVISRDEKMLELVGRYLSLADVLGVRRRMIGTGLIGGKAVGMLLARAILRQNLPRLAPRMELHDSFFIGSDVFYSYLVRNGIWWVRQQQRDSEDFYESATRARRLIITGTFPADVLQQLEEMVDYFGQSPFIVRSSSLLEDNFGHAFAGKYESVFCANQGPRTQRLENLMAAIRTIYASSMSEAALQYRARRGMLDRDEQMALLVMRVSGNRHGHTFFPAAAGVGFSFNPYVWNPDIDPKAGVIRLVFGLGTRAVNRSDEDYTRIVALNAPQLRPEQSFDEVRRYAQRLVDYLDLDANQLVSGHFLDVLPNVSDLPMDLLASDDRQQSDRSGRPVPVLTFERLLEHTPFVGDMRQMLHALHEAYGYPVDTEFTVNFDHEGEYHINLLQCRPLQVQGDEPFEMKEATPDAADIIVAARSAVVGRSRRVPIDYLLYVPTARYAALPVARRYEVARLIGSVNRALPPGELNVLLMGPGRWGTRSPDLGVPVQFSDINRVTVLCEVVAMREELIPDVSLGTHFLNELVEMDMLYLALFPQQEGNSLNVKTLETSPSRLLDLVPGADAWVDVLRVIEAPTLPRDGCRILLAADSRQQRVACYYERMESK
jgi:hypothetical protein